MVSETPTWARNQAVEKRVPFSCEQSALVYNLLYVGIGPRLLRERSYCPRGRTDQASALKDKWYADQGRLWGAGSWHERASHSVRQTTIAQTSCRAA